MFPGMDGILCVARLITAGGFLVRSVQRLNPLEIENYTVPKNLRKLFKRSVKCPSKNAKDRYVKCEVKEHLSDCNEKVKANATLTSSICNPKTNNKVTAVYCVMILTFFL